ncbi:MAG: ATP-binding protein [Chloroflexota bacterium]
MRLLYNPGEFIDREEEIESLHSIASAVSKGVALSSGQRIIHMVGRSQIGKSWFLQKYCDRLSHDESKSFFPVYIDLSSYADLEVDKFLSELLRFIDEKISNELIVSSPFLNAPQTLFIYSSWVLRGLEQIQREKTLVLLLDEVNMLSSDQINALENNLLEAIINQPNIVLVLTGRSVVTGWRSFDLRPMAGINIRNLSKFNYENTELQVVREKPNAKHLTDQIFELSGGSPGINKNILDQARGNPPEIVELDAIRACNREFYEAIGKAGTGLPANLAAELLPALEALCVLPDFDKEYEVPFLLAAHKNLSGNWDVKRSISLFSILTNIQIGPGKLIAWDMSKNAYAIEEQTRTTLEQEIQIRDNELRHTLHCTAMKMYTGWADEYDSDIFRNKAAYHRAKLEQAGFDPADCEAKD